MKRPRTADHGDWSTNTAMKFAKRLGTNPRALAEELASGLAQVGGVASVEVAGPGFINVRLDAAAAGKHARTIVSAGDAYGRNDAIAGETINLKDSVEQQSHGPAPHRPHALGGPRRRDRAAARSERRAGRWGVLHQRRRRADGSLR